MPSITIKPEHMIAFKQRGYDIESHDGNLVAKNSEVEFYGRPNLSLIPQNPRLIPFKILRPMLKYRTFKSIFDTAVFAAAIDATGVDQVLASFDVMRKLDFVYSVATSINLYFRNEERHRFCARIYCPYSEGQVQEYSEHLASIRNLTEDPSFFNLSKTMPTAADLWVDVANNTVVSFDKVYMPSIKERVAASILG